MQEKQPLLKKKNNNKDLSKNAKLEGRLNIIAITPPTAVMFTTSNKASRP